MIKRVIARAGGVQQDYTIRPDAELVAIMVCPKARGTGVAQKLVEEMEKFMASRGYKGPYAIRTERTNERANSFYEKIGAKFVKTVQYYGIEINEWHRSI